MPTLLVNGLELFYQDDDFSDPWRRTQTIFMQHGFSRNGNFWRAWVPTMARHYRVIRPDMRGCGASQDPGPGAEFDVNDIVSDCVGIFDQLGLGAVHYVGEATGGVVGTLLAARHPERILSVTLVSTPTAQARANPALRSAGLESPEHALATLGLKEWWLRTRKDSNDAGDPAQAEYFATQVARTPVHWAISMYNEMHSPALDTTKVLARIQAPVLLLTPGGSVIVSPEQQATMVAGIPNGRQKVYEGAPQGMYYLMPDILARDTLEFINSVSSS